MSKTGKYVISFTAEENTKIEELAKAANLPKPVYIRKVVGDLHDSLKAQQKQTA